MTENPSNPASQTAEPATRKRGAAFWAPWLIAMVVAALAIAMAVENQVLNDQLSDESRLVSNLAAKASHAQQVLEVLTSPSTLNVTLTPGKISNTPDRIMYLADRGGLIFQATDLKPLPVDKTYELWLIPANGQAPLSAGLFRPDARGTASVVLPSLPPGIAAKGFGVTIEKAAGSSTPTIPFLLSGATG